MDFNERIRKQREVVNELKERWLESLTYLHHLDCQCGMEQRMQNLLLTISLHGINNEMEVETARMAMLKRQRARQRPPRKKP